MAHTLWLFDNAEIAEMSGLHRVGGPVEKMARSPSTANRGIASRA